MSVVQLWLDMDGVITDFVGGACAVHRKSEESVVGWDFHYDWGLSQDEFWAKINDQGVKFWSELSNYPWTKEMLTIARNCDKDYRIITTPSRDMSSQVGKINWLAKRDINRDIVFTRKPKSAYCRGRNDVLIDDSDINVQNWVEAGGRAILFPQPWNSASHLIGDRIGIVRSLLFQFIKES